jgi:hypothetical protein
MKRDSLIEALAAEAIGAGANMLEIEYKDGNEEVYAMTGNCGCGLGYSIALLPSSSPEAASLRKELHGMVARNRRIRVAGCDYVLRCSKYDSFGEDAFRVELRRV